MKARILDKQSSASMSGKNITPLMSINPRSGSARSAKKQAQQVG